jgi:phosphoglycolate phosphatase
LPNETIPEQMRRVFFDLDGTLLDSRRRLFSLFTDLVPHHGLSFDEYWSLKRAQYDHENILINRMGYTIKQFERFNSNWMHLIETPKYLQFDVPFQGITEMFDGLRSLKYLLYIATSRQSRSGTFSQLKAFGWQNQFDDVFITENLKTKGLLISSYFKGLAHDDIIIGDTGADIECGNYLNIITIAVLSGFRNKQTLEKYDPDHIFDNVTDIDFTKV